ncbi:putative Actin; cytoskeletal 1A [Paratrimastix pyriformis]|uniref:Actin n=1 Tax=Paratrimastix pyriformis TaxID=342808 RepID=A0ABQ8UT34_9EUKA|nr:putative Actin; cytoskeletal 1A [Paratrimastix pyriformis]
MNWDEIGNSVVLDNGTGTVKAGFSGDDSPLATIPTVLGRPKQAGTLGTNEKELYIGNEAHLKPDVIEHCPLRKGVIHQWEDMELIWHHTFFNELRVAVDEHPVLISEPPLNPKECREHTAQIMFETFHAPALYMQQQAVLALYASGRTTGIVVDSGEEATSTVPIYEGYPLQHAILQLDVAGRTLGEFLMRELTKDGAMRLRMTPEGAVEKRDLEAIREVKERHCRVALDYELSAQPAVPSGPGASRTPQIKWTLPDGQEALVGNASFECPEALFQPSKVGLTDPGIHENCYNSIQRCDNEIRKVLYGNVVLAGGSTMFAGIRERMKKELLQLAPTAMTVAIWSPPERRFSAWIGGSILAGLSSFREMFITRHEWEEQGDKAFELVHWKCF